MTDLKTTIAIIFCILMLSCDNQSNKANILPPEVQLMSDTMFANRRRAIIQEMDSICEVQTPEIIRITRDSLVQLEQDRIQEILRRE